MNLWRNDAFFQIPTYLKSLSNGDIQVPVRYFDASSLIAFFTVDYTKAAQLINTPELEVVKLPKYKALFALAFYDYRSLTDGEPYKEVAACLMVQPKGLTLDHHPLIELMLPPDRRQTGMHILHLPVTTPEACVAGREIWGYPKFVTPITFNLSDQEFWGNVMNRDQPEKSLFELSGTLGFSVPAPWADLVLYSQINHQLIRATATTRTQAGARIASCGSLELTLDTSDSHPMLSSLHALQLNGARPMLVTYTSSLQLRLNEGVVLN